MVPKSWSTCLISVTIPLFKCFPCLHSFDQKATALTRTVWPLEFLRNRQRKRQGTNGNDNDQEKRQASNGRKNRTERQRFTSDPMTKLGSREEKQG
uniref:Secreted protein n=1 Tax=Romanomermis culicivorax TaxID=13658 RepID=A0A915KZ31_ROMCU